MLPPEILLFSTKMYRENSRVLQKFSAMIVDDPSDFGQFTGPYEQHSPSVEDVRRGGGRGFVVGMVEKESYKPLFRTLMYKDNSIH